MKTPLCRYSLFGGRSIILWISFGLCFCFYNFLSGQGCCSGGAGSPIAGGASQGVLMNGQFELSSNFQYFYSNRLKSLDKDTIAFVDHFNSNYLYSKLAFGVTKNFTLSVESGYFFNKTQVGIHQSDTIKSSGFGDLIMFPRYDVINRSDSNRRIELCLGLGYKIPIGKHDDSTLVYTNPVSGQQIFATSPPLVQPTNGSHDFILYGFFLRGFPKQNFRVFANTTFIRKGWNSLGQKFGDYASVGLFAGKTFFCKLGVTLQLKGEWIRPMQSDKNVDMLALYNIDVNSTGSKKISFVPQISFSERGFTLFGLYELPLYQYMNGVQIAARHQVTIGLAYRFFTTKSPQCDVLSSEAYQCEMRCEGGGGSLPGKCKICGMKLKKVK